jgi:thymidylate kinase
MLHESVRQTDQHVDDGLRGVILQRVLSLLESRGVQTCILHGYEELPGRVPSDVDCVVSVDPDRIVQLLEEHQHAIGAQIIRRCAGYVVLVAQGRDGSPAFLSLDLMQDCTVGDLLIYRGQEILASRRRFGTFWIPSASIAFAAYFSRCVYKDRFDDPRSRWLEMLYNEDRTGAVAELSRLWSSTPSQALISEMCSGRWSGIRDQMKALRRELVVGCFRRAPLAWVKAKGSSAARRVRQILSPDGVTVVFLGPDGAGKSSTIAALETLLEPAFARCEVRGFAPALGHLLGRKAKSTAEPHGLPARSPATSLARAIYWLAFNLWSHASLRLARAKSSLVLFDRHFSDILVDPRRYRYGGPRWALQLNAWLTPRPNLVLMLNAPAEVLQARKQEVPFDETSRQLTLYRNFVRPMTNGHLVDATRSPRCVAAEAAWIIVNRQLRVR